MAKIEIELDEQTLECAKLLAESRKCFFHYLLDRDHNFLEDRGYPECSKKASFIAYPLSTLPHLVAELSSHQFNWLRLARISDRISQKISCGSDTRLLREVGYLAFQQALITSARSPNSHSQTFIYGLKFSNFC